MPTIVFASSKGGAGKTTACRLLTGELARIVKDKNIRVTLIDADPNQHSAKWALMDGCPENIDLIEKSNEETIMDDIEKAEENSLFVLVDLEGVASMTVAHAISRADLVVLMTQPSEDDEDELIKTIKLVRRQEKALRRNIPHAVMITRSNAAFLTKMHRAILEDMKTNKVDVYNTSLVERAAFKAIRTFGGIVHNLDESKVAGKENAAKNVEAFARETIMILKKNQTDDKETVGGISHERA